MSVLIKNINAVLPDGVRTMDLAAEDGLLCAPKAKAYGSVLDGTGLIAVPGFIDTHIHGTGGFGTEDGTEEAILGMSRVLLSEGVTTFFPTIYTDTMERILMDEEAIVSAMGKEKGSEIGGIHVEGPFISPNKIGAQNPLGRKDPSSEVMAEILAAGKGQVKAMTCAAERPGIEEVVRLAKENGVVLLQGHTDASYDEALRGMRLGITHATHLFNAMTPLQHRYPGVVGCVLLHGEMTGEIIMDGKHVHPDIIRHVIKTKGPDKVAAITDSLRPTLQKEGALTANGVEVEMGDGLWVTKGRPELIQGSCLTMHKGFINLLRWGVSITDAVKMTSTTPARIYSLDDRGSIETGKRADLVIMEPSMKIRYVFLKGECHVVQ